MHVEVTDDGQLVITPENNAEKFALRHWLDAHAKGFRAELKTIDYQVDKYMEPDEFQIQDGLHISLEVR
ncbi:hypothetical protein BJP27_24565 (plasmid) [Pseudomonas oryzihabitans]|nr:hypothetical protein BJP27_23915 [Pseudomonas psychrotolerans]APQ14745.1 hypothetical protein BJP27_24565 [Pseudomonas psychrotolerans]